MPFNRWVPGVYAAAPANVCALLSGVLLNLGIYGIIRVNGDLLPVSSVFPGLVILVIGSVTALVGILYANRENDMKRMLAESSIENMGIVVAGLGAGMVFSASHLPALAGMAFIAALYQMVNHAVYKALLFYGAGAVDSAAGTSDMDRLGGLIKSLPVISAFFLVGALAIAGLPPLNGFVSEWLTLQSLLQSAVLSSVGVKVVFALCGAALALTAALAVTCFVKVYAMSFLGMPRTGTVRPAGRTYRSLRFAMGFLAVLCLLLGILPTYVIPVLSGPVRQLTGTDSTSALVPAFFAPERETPPAPSGVCGGISRPWRPDWQTGIPGTRVGGHAPRWYEQSGSVCHVHKLHVRGAGAPDWGRGSDFPLRTGAAEAEGAKTGLGGRAGSLAAGADVHGNGLLQPCSRHVQRHLSSGRGRR